jgi:hypothetical protein
VSKHVDERAMTLLEQKEQSINRLPNPKNLEMLFNYVFLFRLITRRTTMVSINLNK